MDVNLCFLDEPDGFPVVPFGQGGLRFSGVPPGFATSLSIGAQIGARTVNGGVRRIGVDRIDRDGLEVYDYFPPFSISRSTASGSAQAGVPSGVNGHRLSFEQSRR